MINQSLPYIIVPTAPPSRIYVSQITSVSVTLAWFAIPFKNHHGVLIGYEILYTEKGENKWMNVTSNTVLRREKVVGGLKKFSEYEFKVAGKTSAGIGVYSPAITSKTKEDGMTLITVKFLLSSPLYQVPPF